MAPDGAKIDLKTGAASPAPAEAASSEPKPATETPEQKDAREKAEKARADDEARDKADADSMDFDTEAKGPKGPEGAEGPKGPEGTKPEPEKTMAEKVIEYATDTLKSAGETAVTAYKSLSAAIAGMPEKTLETLITIGYLIGKAMKLEFLTEWLGPKAKIIKIKKAMKMALGEDKVKSTDNEEAALIRLNSQWLNALDTKAESAKESYTFEVYCQERIDLLAAKEPKQETYTLADLAKNKSPAEAKADADKEKQKEKDAKDSLTLKTANAVLTGDVWTVPDKDLGKNAAGVAIKTVQFKKIDGTWQWRNSTEPAGTWLGQDYFPEEGTDEVKKNRKAMNDLAKELGVNKIA